MEEINYKIEKPDWPSKSAKGLNMAFAPEMKSFLEKTDHEYLSWQDLKNKDWIPGDKLEFWAAVKLYRMTGYTHLPVFDQNGQQFKMKINHYARFLHMIDKEMAGSLIDVSDFSETDKRRFITSNLIEESIASSQLEGANTSRAAAKKMLMEGRPARDKSEQMILNNHQTMTIIEERLKKEPLSFSLLCELHRKITYKTLPEEQQGVLRETFDTGGKPLIITPWDESTVTYVAPPKDFVERELPKLIDFANDKGDEDFIHPMIKAIILHFWIGLLHPFEDGNGRLARIIFYWYALRNNYWAFAYISLSEKILKSSKQYAMAYIFSEQDDNDLTYFIDYNIRKIEMARAAFIKYADRKIAENRDSAFFIRKNSQFNERQARILQHLHKNRQRYTSITEYSNIHGIGRVTAIADLKKLVELGFLMKQRNGKNVYYLPTGKVWQLF